MLWKTAFYIYKVHDFLQIIVNVFELRRIRIKDGRILVCDSNLLRNKIFESKVSFLYSAVCHVFEKNKLKTEVQIDFSF